jgi:hypothetical protein
MRRAVMLLAVLVGACSLERSGLAGDGDGGADATSPPRDGSPPRPDAGDDAFVPDDAGPDAELPDADRGDAAVETDACVAVAELCNGLDEDCDARIDEAGCDGCEPREIAGGTYLFCVTDRTWADARTDCVGRGYDLVVLDDAIEDRAVWAEARALRVIDWWIGLQDMLSEGTYVWVDGRTIWSGGAAFGYTNWRTGVPKGLDFQDCAELDGEGSDGLWADEGCGRALPYVCEL